MTQAWRNSVSNVKAQLQHQENRLMNLELMEEHVANVWLQQNSALEQIYNNYTEQTVALNKQLRELNKTRLATQERAFPDLAKLTHRRDSAVVQRLQCQAAHQQIDAYLTQNGFSFQSHRTEQEQLAARDLLSAEHNGTVRAYETVHESEAAEGGSDSKRMRIA